MIRYSPYPTMRPAASRQRVATAVPTSRWAPDGRPRSGPSAGCRGRPERATTAKATSRTTVSATAAATTPTVARDSQSMCMGDAFRGHRGTAVSVGCAGSLTFPAGAGVRREALENPEAHATPVPPPTTTPAGRRGEPGERRAGPAPGPPGAPPPRGGQAAATREPAPPAPAANGRANAEARGIRRALPRCPGGGRRPPAEPRIEPVQTCVVDS